MLVYYFIIRKNQKQNKNAKNKNKQKSIKEQAKAAIKAALISAGGGIGGYVGGPAGSMLGSKVGAFVSRIVGAGQYTVKNNTLMGPAGYKFGDATTNVRIQHREYLTDIVASTDFALQSFPIQPGDTTTFPWFSRLASSFQQYQLKGCVFYFRSMSAEWSGNSQTIGTIIMGTQYNAEEPNFMSKVEMLAHEFSCSSKATQDLLHPVECARNQTFNPQLFLRTEELKDEDDIMLYDWGNFQIATVGFDGGAVGTVIGELWVTYDIELLKPRLNRSIGLGDTYFHYRTIGAIDSLPLGDSTLATATGSLPVAVGDYSNALNLPPGGSSTIVFSNRLVGAKFLVELCWSVDNANADVLANPGLFTTSCTLVNWYPATGTGGQTYFPTSSCVQPVGDKSPYNSLSFVVEIDDYNPDHSKVDIAFSGDYPIDGQSARFVATIVKLTSGAT